MLPAYRVMHTRYTVWNGVWGLSPIRQAMNALGVASAAEEFGARYFGNGSRPSIILKHPGRLQADAYKRLRGRFGELGRVGERPPDQHPRRGYFAGGGGYSARGSAIPADAAIPGAGNRTALWRAAAHARRWRTATYASAEQEAINFRQLTMLPWASRDEDRLEADLLTKAERDAGYYIEYLLDGIEAGHDRNQGAGIQHADSERHDDAKRRASQREHGPAARAAMLLMPLNMQMIGADGEMIGMTGQSEQQNPAPSDNQRSAADILLADVRRRLVARVANDVRQAGAKACGSTGGGLSDWGEGQQLDWRHAGLDMAAPVMQAFSLGDPPVADWWPPPIKMRCGS